MGLILDSAKGEQQFQYGFTWVVVVCLLICAIGQVHILNLGLKECDQLVMIPQYFVFNLLLTVVSGLVFYQRLNDFDGVADSSIFVTSLIIIMLGVFFLTRGDHQRQQTEKRNSFLNASNSELNTSLNTSLQ